MSSLFRRHRRDALATTEPVRPVLAAVPPPPPPSQANPGLIGHIEEPAREAGPYVGSGGRLIVEVEEWPREDAAVVDRMRAVRPGLTVVQAHMALQALRTLGLAARDGGTGEVEAAVCGHTTGGLDDIPLRCVERPHAEDDWHRDARGTQWRDRGAGHSTIHAPGQ